jgi:hypothetical protein
LGFALVCAIKWSHSVDEVRTNHKFAFAEAARTRRKDFADRLNRSSYVAMGEGRQPHARRIRQLAGAGGAQSVVFQSVTVAAHQAIERVLAREREVASAAISLAQGEKLRDMIESLEAVLDALHQTLSAQGMTMLHMAPERAHAVSGDRSWWFTLTEALQSLDDGIQRISAIVSGQPRGGPARTLSSVVVRLLRQHHRCLMDEAEQWIT